MSVLLYQARNPAQREIAHLSCFGVIFVLLAAVLFLIPLLQTWLLPIFWFAAKTGVMLFTFIWVRGTLPRFRYDQLMGFAWKFLFPVALLNLLVTGFLVAWTIELTWTHSYFSSSR